VKTEFYLNGVLVTVDAPGETTLLDALRDHLRMTGTKRGCDIGECGACSVLIDGRLRKACITLLAQVRGCAVRTVEGFQAGPNTPNDLQEAFIRHGAVQCGYCIPGMVLAGEALLAENPQPSREAIREAISGNLCRCTGYQQIVDAIEDCARLRAGEAR
jgi:aerobic-type carbon monoxide dehydrogenase small subunit (CoxS/CutS family)